MKTSKSVIKLYLDKETIEKLCGDNPEIKVELEQAALKWVKQSVIKPLIDKSAAKYIEEAKEDIKKMTNTIMKDDVFNVNSWHKRFENNSYCKKLSDIACSLIIKELTPDNERIDFWKELKERKDIAMADFENRITKSLDQILIDDLLRTTISSRVGDVVKKMVEEAHK